MVDPRETSQSSGRRKRRPQSRATATRGRVLAAAGALFTREGYDATTVQQVAGQAEVGVGTVYHHFADKRQILLALIDAWGERVVEERRGALDLRMFFGQSPRRAVYCWLRGAYDRLSSEPSLYLLVLSMSERDEDVRRRYQQIEQVAIERLRSLIEFAQSEGSARADVDPAAAAFLVHHAIDMAATQLLVRAFRGPDPDVVLGELASMICRYLLGDCT